MPYVANETLRQRLDREGRLPIDEAIRIATGIAAALEHGLPHAGSRADYSSARGDQCITGFDDFGHDASPVVRILPLARLKANTRYTLQIEQAASRDLGEMLAGRVSTSFTTNNQ